LSTSFIENQMAERRGLKTVVKAIGLKMIGSLPLAQCSSTML